MGIPLPSLQAAVLLSSFFRLIGRVYVAFHLSIVPNLVHFVHGILESYFMSCLSLLCEIFCVLYIVTVDSLLAIDYEAQHNTLGIKWTNKSIKNKSRQYFKVCKVNSTSLEKGLSQIWKYRA